MDSHDFTNSITPVYAKLSFIEASTRKDRVENLDWKALLDRIEDINTQAQWAMGKLNMMEAQLTKDISKMKRRSTDKKEKDNA